MSRYYLLVNNDDEIVGSVKRASLAWVVTYEGTTDILGDKAYDKFLRDNELHIESV